MDKREVLLKAGIPESKVDDVLEKIEQGPADSSVNMLKALLNKADDDDDDDGDEYNEEYMKKYSKKFLKENGDYAKGQMKELGLLKAEVASIDYDIDGEATAIMIDGTEQIEKLTKAVESLVDVLVSQEERIEGMEKAVAFTSELSEKMAAVSVEQADALEMIKAQPLNPKGFLFGDNIEEKNKSLIKAIEAGYDGCLSLLIKAAKDGDEQAGYAITEFESARGDLSKAPVAHKVLDQILQ